MKTVLLIDGNSLAHANHNATKLTVGTFQVQAIFGFLKSLRLLLERSTSETRPIVLWDGKAQWRMDIYPEYKGNRKALDAKQAAHKEAFKAQGPLLEAALEALGVMQIRSPHLEADDIAGHMVFGTLKGQRIKLISGDQDWIQLVSERVDWFDPIRDRKVTVENFYEYTGYKDVRAFVQGKALQGDTSDNVPGVGGIGEKGAPLFLAEHGSVESFFAKVDAGTKMKLNKAQQNLASPEGRALFERNMKLMDLSQARKLKPGEAVVRHAAPDPKKFIAICRRLAFASILREMPQFLSTFGVRSTETV